MKYALFLAVLTAQVQGWWKNGHLMTAKIAEQILAQESPETLKKAQDILSVLSESMPSQTTGERDHPFVECSTWADDVKARGGSFQSNWHFVDTPYLDQGGDFSDFNIETETYNITNTLTNLQSWILKEPGYDSTYQYEQIMGAFGGLDEDQGLSVAMRLVIHFVGDIHQPLHAESRYNKQYPSGDRGGNSFRLPSSDGIYNLHSAYDSVMYEFPQDS